MNNTTTYQNYPNANRNYKDALFRMVFSKKEDLLDLYNAINGSSYTNPDELEVNTLERALYMSIKNDVSFLIDHTLNLYEHQSTFNPNMPIRGLTYIASLFERHIAENHLDIFSSTIQKLPTPRYIVFYNGTQEQPDHQDLYLSDAFQEPGGCLECKVTMLNINYGRNKELMQKCQRLNEYSYFIDRVRYYTSLKSYPLSTCINLAIDHCIQNSILKDVLTTQRAEVHEMLLYTFDQELHEKTLKNEAELKGRIEGRIEGKIEAQTEIIQRMLGKDMSPDDIANLLDMDIQEVNELIAKIK